MTQHEARLQALEEAAQIAKEIGNKGPWSRKELVLWRRACTQIEDVIRSRMIVKEPT